MLCCFFVLFRVSMTQDSFIVSESVYCCGETGWKFPKRLIGKEEVLIKNIDIKAMEEILLMNESGATAYLGEQIYLKEYRRHIEKTNIL